MNPISLSPTIIAIPYTDRVEIQEQLATINGIPQVNTRVLRGKKAQEFLRSGKL